jgi:hypothetical protein
VILLGHEHRAVVEKVRIRVVSVDKENFGNVSAPRPALDMDDDVEGIGDVCLDCSKANVRPATTIATSESPRAIVLVKAVIKTLTAFSQGELPPCAKVGAARKRPMAAVARKRERMARGRSRLHKNIFTRMSPLRFRSASRFG